MQSRQPEDLIGASGGHLAACAFQSRQEWGAGVLRLGVISLTELQLICVQTTPLHAHLLDNGRVNVGLSYGGDLVYEADGHCTTARPGDLLLCPNNGGVLSTDLCSGIAFQFDPKRLLRTMAVMLGHENGALDLSQAQALPTSRCSASGKPGGLLRELVAFIDRLRQENELLPEAMGLEDQCFRSLALELLHANGRLDDLRRRRRHPGREAFLDDLVDYIMANLDRPITLTDLEEQSHYSGRQLQYMFRRKFECTPLQFVRKQRLNMAMARLEQCQRHDTVSKIARELGYRSTSTFSADFFRQFGTYPSVVLRCQRQHQQACEPAARARPGPESAEANTAAIPKLSSVGSDRQSTGLCPAAASAEGDAAASGDAGRLIGPG